MECLVMECLVLFHSGARNKNTVELGDWVGVLFKMDLDLP